MISEIVFFGRTIPMYGVLGVTGALFGMLYILLRAPKFGADRENAVYIYVLGAVGAMIGAKLLFILVEIPDILRALESGTAKPSEIILSLANGGMVFYGGLIGGILAAWWCAKIIKTKLTDYLILLVPALALAHSIARIGCFSAGCCYGAETSSWIGHTYTNSLTAPNGVPLLPIQLIEAFGVFLIFIFLVWYTSSPKREHYTLAMYIILYAPMRFILEFFRGDSLRGFILGLSTSQWISAALFIITVLWLIRETPVFHRLSKKHTD